MYDLSVPVKKNLKSIDLFSGCGGMSLGLSLSSHKGRKIVSHGSIDIWDDACATFESNLGLKPICGAVNEKQITDLIGRIGKVDIVVGGPPCQGFSTSGKRALGDKRNRLVREFLNSVEIVAPRAFVLENVSGFTSFQDGKIFNEVFEYATKLGFRVSSGILLSSRAGVPQRRRRFFMVGIVDRVFEFPNSIVRDQSINSLLDVDQRSDDGFPVVSFNDATSDLPVVRSGGKSSKYRYLPRNEYQEWARGEETQVTEHFSSRHSEEFVEMMSYLKPGESALDPEVAKRIPSRLRPRSGFPNSYARIRGNLPAPTITRNFTTPSSANCIHPKFDRALTLREGARCQSFPDRYQFLGTSSSKRLQIGNAVPPLLAKTLGDSLLKALS